MSKVSIIIPVYNPQAGHLIECLESVINQTFKNLELIIIDNASTDDNSKILEDYSKKDSRINLIKFKNNMGYSGACNKGLSIATGKYIQFVDSDDWLEHDAVEKLYNFMEEHLESDFCFFKANVYDDSISKITDNTVYHFTEIHNRFANNYFDYASSQDIIFSLPSQAWNKFYRRKFLHDTQNCFDIDLGTVLVDAFFSFNNYLNASKMILCPHILYNYRVNIKNSVVSSLSSKNFKYTNKPIIFAQKLEEIQQNKKISGSESRYFVKSCIEELHWFYTLYDKKNLKYFHNDLRNYLNTNDKNIYTQENINASGFGNWYRMVQLFPFEIYNFIKFLYSKVDREDYYRLKIFSITIFKRVISDDYIEYKLFGIIKFKLKNNNGLTE